MIVDRLENWGLYFKGNCWETVASFLASLKADTPEGEYPLQGQEVFAKVMLYETRGPDTATFESHREYIDIQAVLVGAEGIAWHPTTGLEVRDKYDPVRDVEFHHTPLDFPARVDVLPGHFVALFPHDAHMPQLTVSGMPPWVKKVVVKVAVTLFA